MELSELFRIVVGFVLPVVFALALAWLGEVGFEGLVSQPLVEKYAKTFKHFQPFLLLAVFSLFAYGFNIDLLSLLEKVYPLVSSEGDTGKIVTSVLVAILSMVWHSSR